MTGINKKNRISRRYADLEENQIRVCGELTDISAEYLFSVQTYEEETVARFAIFGQADSLDGCHYSS